MMFAEAQVRQRRRFRWRRRTGAPSSAIQSGRNAQRIAGDDHVAHGVQQHDVVRPVELLGQTAETPSTRSGRCPPPAARGDVVHDDFGVGVARQVIVALIEQLLAQLGVVGELAVEGEANHLALQPCWRSNGWA